MKPKNILVWFRNDLRLHDNEMLAEAVAKSDRILPVYFFDPRHFMPSGEEMLRTGILRAKFLLESVEQLRQSFQQMGGNILLIKGLPEEQLPALIERYEISEVYHHREIATADTQVSVSVEDNLWKYQVNLRHFIGHTLFNKEDLPFPIKDIPDVFAQFKKKSERDASVKPCIESPSEIDFVDVSDWGELPSLTDLGMVLQEVFNDSDNMAKGGENEGLSHLKSLLKIGSTLYQKNNNKADIDTKFTSRLSSWLSTGCLSPRKVYWMIKEAEGQKGSNLNFNQILLGLLWRDYFRFMFKKYGSDFCNVPVLEARPVSVALNKGNLFEQWKKGATGNVIVDRYMSQLNNTGFIPHAARILVATFLIYSLKVDWTLGAAYFEEKLIDYASASNWGNWAIIANSTEGKPGKFVFDVDKYLRMLASEAVA